MALRDMALSRAPLFLCMARCEGSLQAGIFRSGMGHHSAAVHNVGLCILFWPGRESPQQRHSLPGLLLQRARGVDVFCRHPGIGCQQLDWKCELAHQNLFSARPFAWRIGVKQLTRFWRSFYLLVCNDGLLSPCPALENRFLASRYPCHGCRDPGDKHVAGCAERTLSGRKAHHSICRAARPFCHAGDLSPELSAAALALPSCSQSSQQRDGDFPGLSLSSLCLGFASGHNFPGGGLAPPFGWWTVL